MNTFTDVRPKFVLYPVNSNLYPVSNTDGDVIPSKGKERLFLEQNCIGDIDLITVLEAILSGQRQPRAK